MQEFFDFLKANGFDCYLDEMDYSKKDIDLINRAVRNGDYPGAFEITYYISDIILGEIRDAEFIISPMNKTKSVKEEFKRLDKIIRNEWKYWDSWKFNRASTEKTIRVYNDDVEIKKYK